MVIVCQQPNFFPWIGYYEQIARSERFVFLDSVQWIRQGRQHRTQIWNGSPHWLTIPVLGHGHRSKMIKDMQIDISLPWARKQRATLQSLYGKAPFWKSQLEPKLLPFYEKVAKEKFLLDVCQESLYLFLDELGLKSELHWSSDIATTGESTDRLVSLCQALGAETYYSALGSTRYLDLSRFRAAGINVRWQHFRAGDVERPLTLSVLDWLARESFASVSSRISSAVLAPRQSLDLDVR